MHLRSADRRRHTVHGPREAGKKLDAKDQLDVNHGRKCVQLIKENKKRCRKKSNNHVIPKRLAKKCESKLLMSIHVIH